MCPWVSSKSLQIEIARFEPLAGAIGRVEQNPTLRGRNEIAVSLENAAAESLVNHRCCCCFKSNVAIFFSQCFRPKTRIRILGDLERKLHDAGIFSPFLNVHAPSVVSPPHM